jgi:hypothetical protein
VWSKKFLNSSAWPLLQEEDIQPESLQFSIPMACPKNVTLCSARDLNSSETEDFETSHTVQGTPERGDQTKQLHSSTTLLMPRKRKQRQMVLVDSDLRRSLRIKAYNIGFKCTGCGRTSCFGCELDPPPMFSKVIRNLGERFCKMDPKDLAELILRESHTKKKAVMKMHKKKEAEGQENLTAQGTNKNHLKNEDKNKKNRKEGK